MTAGVGQPTVEPKYYRVKRHLLESIESMPPGSAVLTERDLAAALDAAGVPPKIALVLTGHATPQRQPGAAQITLARYTQALPEEIEEARERLGAYLGERGRRATEPVKSDETPGGRIS